MFDIIYYHKDYKPLLKREGVFLFANLNLEKEEGYGKISDQRYRRRGGYGSSLGREILIYNS